MKRVFAAATLALAALTAALAQQQQSVPQPARTPAAPARPAQTQPAPSQTPSQPSPAQTPAQSQPAAQPSPNPHPQRTADGHEFAPLEERALDYKNWTLRRAAGDGEIDLREWARGKRLVMVVYFAPWCGNWRLEKPVVARLYEKYHPQGFDVIAVSNYAPIAELRQSLEVFPLPYPVVVESDSFDAREKTTHFDYRTRTGDARKWGSPYNVILEPARLARSGDVLAEKVWVVGGELVESEVERFIRERLGLPKLEAAK
jgi:thiol-disulfide isomerase/thioredoxin